MATADPLPMPADDDCRWAHVCPLRTRCCQTPTGDTVMLPLTLRNVREARVIPANHSGTDYLIRQLNATRHAASHSVRHCVRVVLVAVLLASVAWGVRLLICHANGGSQHDRPVPVAPSNPDH